MNTQVIKSFEMNWQSLKRATPDWFRDAKFGLFFHWGPYCVPAHENEWYSRNMYAKGLSQNLHHIKTYGKLNEFGYKDFYPMFKGEMFDPYEWASIVVSSGAKYAGIVTEHADNFSMWNSKINVVNSVNYGPKRDVAGELKKALKSRDIRFITTFHHQWLWGWFMSTVPDADVYVPENEIFYGKALPLETNRYIPWRLPDEEFNRVWMKKVVEVIDSYDPDMVYFDSRANIIAEKYKHKLVDHYYNGPNAKEERIITYKQEDFPEGTGIRDVECGCYSDIQSFVWQTDDRLEAKRTWCYVQNPEYKKASAVIHQLCDVVSKNGNLLLNVGPKVDGTFDDGAKKVLYEIGDWLNIHGEAIFGTRPFAVCGEGKMDMSNINFDVTQIEAQTKKGIIDNDFAREQNSGEVRFTTKGNALYAIILGSPKYGKVEIKSLAEGSVHARFKIAKIDLIGSIENPRWKRDAASLLVEFPPRMTSSYANVLKITYEK